MLLTLKTKGVSLVELIIVIAILGTIAAISTSVFQSMYASSTRRGAADETYRALTDAQSSTLASDGDTVYGVHIDTASVTRFEGPTYTPGSATNKVFTFGKDITATGTLAVNGTDIVFRRLTGEPSASGTIYVRDMGEGTTTIVIHGTGLIEYQ